jgi:hypothetical protein
MHFGKGSRRTEISREAFDAYLNRLNTFKYTQSIHYRWYISFSPKQEPARTMENAV